MANSAISLCSNALVLLGTHPISSFNDNDTGSQIASYLYTTTYHAMLTETLWHFATRTEQLARLIEEPTNGYQYKYQLPQDCLYVIRTDTSIYEIFEKQLYANTPTLSINYVYTVDENNLPPYFAKALEYNLASIFAIPITGNASRGDFYRGLYETELKKAKRADSSQRPATQIGRNRLIEARYV